MLFKKCCVMALLMAQMTTASAMGVSVIVGLVIWLFAASHASRQRYERRKWLRLIEQIRGGLEQRGQVGDDLACESVPIESRAPREPSSDEPSSPAPPVRSAVTSAWWPT